jgi:hypothetical protein
LWTIDLFMFMFFFLRGATGGSSCIWDNTTTNQRSMMTSHQSWNRSNNTLAERVRCQATFRSAYNAGSPKQTRQSKGSLFCSLHANALRVVLVVEVGQSSRKVRYLFTVLFSSYINVMMNWKRDHRLETFLLRRWSSTAHIQYT